MSNHFLKNLETGKIELHFDRATYQALPADKKQEIKRNFLWSKSASAWVSRSSKNTYWPQQIAKGLGLEDQGQEGERLSFAEQVEQKVERAEARAERMDARADKAAAESANRHKAVHAIGDMIPMGQPILIGHHSERRHRRDLARMDNHMRKAVEASQKSEYYEGRAAIARDTAAAGQLQDKGFLGRRIKDGETDERLLLRRVDEAVRRDDAEWLDRLHTPLSECRDKLTFYRQCLQDLGGVTYSKANVKPGDFVLIRGHWEEVVKANPTTVAVPNICYPTPESQRQYAMKYPYAEIKGHRPKQETP